MARKTGAVVATNGNGTVDAHSEPSPAKSRLHLDGMKSEPSIGKPIELPRLDIRMIQIRIVGDSPLITNRWSEKARQMILDKQMGKASEGKAPKDPQADFEASLYVIERSAPFSESTFGFPSLAFKNAAVSACTSLGKSVTKVQARQAFHTIGEYVRIEGTPRLREDMVRVGMGTADIRFRGEFPEWSTILTVRYNARVLTDEQVVNLFNTAGFAVGIGEWRPERDGMYGMFHVG